jgi:hypothetical protein
MKQLFKFFTLILVIFTLFSCDDQAAPLSDEHIMNMSYSRYMAIQNDTTCIKAHYVINENRTAEILYTTSPDGKIAKWVMVSESNLMTITFGGFILIIFLVFLFGILLKTIN